MLSDWPLLLSWASSGRAESHFGEAGVTNLLHLLRDALAKATGGPLLGGAPGGEARRAGQRDRQQAQVRVGCCVLCVGRGWSSRGQRPAVCWLGWLGVWIRALCSGYSV